MSTFKNTLFHDLQAFYTKPLDTQTKLQRRYLFLRALIDSDFRIVFYFRLCSLSHGTRFESLGKLLHLHVKSRHAVDIHYKAKIGAGLKLMHGFNIAIGPEAEIGRYCKVFNGVSIGKARPDKAALLMPKIGSYCILGTGAKLIGELNVADGVIIGANAVIREDVSPELASFQAIKEHKLASSVSEDYKAHLENLSQRR
jgi:serine acetyltransferase